MIGRDWVSSADSLGQRRLDDPHDWVRTETRQLLERNIRVIPVLVGGAAMPQAKDLPEDMRALVKRQARELRDTAWDADVEALMQRLDEVLGVGASRQASAATGSSKRWIGLGAAAVVVAGVGAWFTRSDPVVDAGDGESSPSKMAARPASSRPHARSICSAPGASTTSPAWSLRKARPRRTR